MENLHFENEKKSLLFSVEKKSGTYVMNKNHFHDSYEIYFLLFGSRKYFIKDRIHTVLPGDIVIIDRNDIHQTFSAKKEEYKRFLIEFKPEFLHIADEEWERSFSQIFSYKSPIVAMSEHEKKLILDYFLKMQLEVYRKDIGFEFMLQSFILQLLTILLRNSKENKLIKSSNDNTMHKKVFQVVTYINDNFMESITLKTMSDKFFISSFYLCKVFKESTGFSFIEFLNNVRINEAIRLLRKTTRNVTLISEDVGFSSISNFGRVFKDITGLSPLHYRKINKE